MDLTESDIAKLQNDWSQLARTKPAAREFTGQLLIDLFVTEPSYRSLFQFLQGREDMAVADMWKETSFKIHQNILVKYLGTAIKSLNDKDKVRDIFMAQGRSHAKLGVRSFHCQTLAQLLVDLVQHRLGEDTDMQPWIKFGKFISEDMGSECDAIEE